MADVPSLKKADVGFSMVGIIPEYFKVINQLESLDV